MAFVQHDTLTTLLDRVDAAFNRPGRLFLIGETSLLLEGRRSWIDQVEYAVEVTPADQAAFDETMERVADEMNIAVLDEHPGTLIPLPDGYEERHRPIESEAATTLRWYHFDPYSVAYRFIARGSEPDYHLVLNLLDHGWLTFEEMDARLSDLLPRFSMETIQQDPAEFRRKYKGLGQMWRALRPGMTHRPTPA